MIPLPCDESFNLHEQLRLKEFFPEPPSPTSTKRKTPPSGQGITPKFGHPKIKDAIHSRFKGWGILAWLGNKELRDPHICSLIRWQRREFSLV